MGADFEAGSIFIAFRSATDALARGFRKVRTLFGGMSLAAVGMRRIMSGAARAIGRAFRTMGRLIARVSLVVKIALGAMAFFSVKWASELIEATNKANVVFGEHVKIVEDFARTSARDFGISAGEAFAYASTLGQILKVSGLTAEASAVMSVKLLKLAADMASFNDISIDEALTKIRSGLVGEVEPLRQVGVLLSEAAVQAKAFELGLARTTNELTDQIKVQARVALIFEQTADAQGDFARTSEEFTNSLRIVRKQIKGILEIVGAAVLPFLTMVLNRLKVLLDFFPIVFDVISDLFKQLRGSVAGAGLGAVFQKVVTAGVDFFIDIVTGMFKFLRENFIEVLRTLSRLAIDIAGPSVVKLMKHIAETVKSGLLQFGAILAIPVNIMTESVLSFGFFFNKWIRELMVSALRKISETLQSIRALGIAEVFGIDIEKATEGVDKLAFTLAKSAGKFGKGIRKFGDIVRDEKNKAVDSMEAIQEAVAANRQEIEAEIDALVDGLKESGELGAAMESAAVLLRKGFKAGSDVFKAGLDKALEGTGISIDAIIEKIKAARIALGLKTGDLDEGAVAVPTVGAAAGGLSADEQKVIDDLAKATRDSISSAVAGGIADGVLEGKSALEILADVGRRLFKDAFNNAVQSFQKALDTALQESGVKASALMSGILNAAVAIVGLLLSMLDRAGDSSKRFGKIGAEVESSQLVRGVIAGPSNVAIAEVGENLRRALATTEELLRQSLFVQIETRDALGGRGNGVASPSQAGNTPTVSP